MQLGAPIPTPAIYTPQLGVTVGLAVLLVGAIVGAVVYPKHRSKILAAAGGGLVVGAATYYVGTKVGEADLKAFQATHVCTPGQPLVQSK